MGSERMRWKGEESVYNQGDQGNNYCDEGLQRSTVEVVERTD